MCKIFVGLIFALTTAIAATSSSSPARAATLGPIGFEMKSWLGRHDLTTVHYRRRYHDHYVHRHYYAPRYYTNRVYEYAPPAVVYYPPPIVYYPPPVVRPYYESPVAYEDADVDVEYSSRHVAPYYTGW